MVKATALFIIKIEWQC